MIRALARPASAHLVGTREEALNERWQRRQPVYRSGSSPGPLFVTRSRRAFTPRRVQQIVREVGDHIGADLSPNRLRQGMAGALLDGGMPIELVQELLGHAGVDTTQVSYAAAPSSTTLRASYRKACRSQSSPKAGAQ